MSYVRGQWKVCCDRCGLRYKSGDLRREWTGLRTCSDCYDAKHPQLNVRGVRDPQSPPWARPAPAEIFTSVDGDVSEDDL